ncbi:MAG: hypothetical protein K2H85_06365 [Allobaculum sp.]|nr:hypothetical protein [Allobaculum sp.]
MRSKKICLFFLLESFLFLLFLTFPVYADDMDGITDFFISYIDSSGLIIANQDLEVLDEIDGLVFLDFEQLTLPENYSLAQPWEPISVIAGEDLGVEVFLVYDEEDVENYFSKQTDHPQTTSLVALTFNYWTETGVLVDCQTFFYEDLRGWAGGGAFQSLYLDVNYRIQAPMGYKLLSTPLDQYNISNRSRKIIDLVVTLGTDTSYPSKESEEGDYEACISYYQMENGQKNVVGVQCIPFFGEGTVQVSQDLLELPEGYTLNQRWPAIDPYVSNANLSVPIEVIATSSGPSTSSLNPSSEKEEPRRATSVNTSVWSGLKFFILMAIILVLFKPHRVR